MGLTRKMKLIFEHTVGQVIPGSIYNLRGAAPLCFCCLHCHVVSRSWSNDAHACYADIAYHDDEVYPRCFEVKETWIYNTEVWKKL